MDPPDLYIRPDISVPDKLAYGFFLHAELAVSRQPEIKGNWLFVLLAPLCHSGKLAERFYIAGTFSLVMIQDLPDVLFFLHHPGDKNFLPWYPYFPADIKLSHGAYLDPVCQPRHLFYQKRICLHGKTQSCIFSQNLPEAPYLFCRLVYVKNIQGRPIFFRTPDQYLFSGHLLPSSLFCSAPRSVFPFFVSGSLSV